LAVKLCVMVCVLAAVISLWTRARDVRTADQNRDGRPDVWRVYDRQGQLTAVAVDTNFDGRSDVHEYYTGGALVRRESDRDFNDRVDLVQEFDAITREAVRSVSDVDLDGAADLLVLFQGGRPVYSQWADGRSRTAPAGFSARPIDASRSPGDHPLVALEDPFRGDLAVTAIRFVVGLDDYVGLATSGGLPEPRRDADRPLAFSSVVSRSPTSHPASASVVQYSPRGPPLSHLLS